MNIKRAKQEIKDAIEAYLLKDEYGAYVIPQIRQRPVLLLGAPGIGKTQIMEQIASGSWPIRSRTIRGRVRSVCRLSRSMSTAERNTPSRNIR